MTDEQHSVSVSRTVRQWPLRNRLIAVCAATLVLALCTACSGFGGHGETVQVDIGYQSKTINTVNAGTLLRDTGAFEDQLKKLERTNGLHYDVRWHDYDTGAPITAQMVAEKIDIGSMGDFPLLINGSKSQPYDLARTELIAVTGYNIAGGLNGIVTPGGSSVADIGDLAGGTVSTSSGSAGHGLLIRAMRGQGLAMDGVTVENQTPSVGSTGLRAGTVDGLSQFVPWPGLLAFEDGARLVYDGSQSGASTFHGVVAGAAYSADHPEVISAFLRAMRSTTNTMQAGPFKAARRVATLTGLPPEVVYLYNGPNGVATFDMTLKPSLVDALRHDHALLEQVEGDMPLDLDRFVNDSYLRHIWEGNYDRAASDDANHAAIGGGKAHCGNSTWDPALASEVWVNGEERTRAADTPTCALRLIRNAGVTRVRAGYVPDADTGMRWFADESKWVRDLSRTEGNQYLPFATLKSAQTYLRDHSTATLIDFTDALAQA